MDDLSSLEWTAPKAAPAAQQQSQRSGAYYPALRPTPPISGRSTPSALQPTGKVLSNPPSRSNESTSNTDSFANLVSFGGPQTNKALSLQEQQRQLQQANSRREAERNRVFDSQFGASNTTSWDTLGDGRTTPNRVTSPPTYTATSEYGGQKLSQVINKPFAGIPTVSSSSITQNPAEDEDDILAAFNASAPVDKSSHMPAASRSSSIKPLSTTIGIGATGAISSLTDTNGFRGDLVQDPDDDPFGLGLNGVKNPSTASPAIAGPAGDNDGNDDVLGLLGRPVSEFSSKVADEKAPAAALEENKGHPQKRAVAELVDMGFAPDKSRVALETTESGTDVQAAVGWLLNQAHEDSRGHRKSEKQGSGSVVPSRSPQTRREPGRRKSSTSTGAKPAWMREQEPSNASQGHPESKSPINGDKDPTQYASEISNKMFKTAGSLWKTGTKKLNQAVQELNSDSDSTQPKWMRDTPGDGKTRKPRAQGRVNDANDHKSVEKRAPRVQTASIPDVIVTDEALMLEADSRPASKSRAKAQLPQHRPPARREQPPAFVPSPREHGMPQPKFTQQTLFRDPKAKLSREVVEQETSQAYISPARRKRPTPKATVVVEPEPDLLFETSRPTNQAVPSRAEPPNRPLSIPSTSLPSHTLTPKRPVPSLSSFALQASTKERQEGNSAFKRGDYAQATMHYSTSLSAIPPTHPLAIVLLTNRALSHSKTGDVKGSLADAKSALDLIGVARGANEVIELSGGEGNKQMTTYWEKAMIRQAEALEHLERWSDAAAIWRTCVEAGVGGASTIAGRNRSEKAAESPSQAKLSAQKKITIRPRPKATALGDLAPDSASVTRLRAANAAADRIDDEKFALADLVDARVSKWRAGKEGNLRALLSTLENVLWSESGWKKVGMGDVLLPGKVKLVYMKGIAKVHPDKLPTTATTEQRMISAAVFATLNEAWERFKTENGL